MTKWEITINERISSPSREADLLWMGKNLPIILPRWVRNFLWLLNGNSLWYNNPILFCLTDHLQLVRAQSSYTFSSYPHSLPSWFHLVAWLWLPHTCSWLPTCISSFDFSLNSSFHCWTASTVYPMGTSNSWHVQNKTCQSSSISVKNLAFFYLVSKVCGLVTEGLVEICHPWFLFSHTPHPMQLHITLAQIFKTIFRIWPILTSSITPTLAPKGPVSLIPLYFLTGFLPSVLAP